VAPGRAAVPAGHWIELGSLTPRGAPERPVRAYVPGVPTPEGRPLLVLFDGQNVFGDEGSYAGGWHAHTAVDGMTAKTVVRPIVVAVHHGGVHRNRELGHDVRWTLDAVVHDLMPTVEARFRLAGPRVIGGASLGGLAALHACLERPGVFDGGLIMSPSLWYARHALLHAVVRGRLTVPPDLRLYVDAGGRERGRMFADAELLTRLLAERGLPEDRLMWRPDARGAHHERAWRRRLPKALRFLFRAPI
jgi:enterochelin esterase-like enzyme